MIQIGLHSIVVGVGLVEALDKLFQRVAAIGPRILVVDMPVHRMPAQLGQSYADLREELAGLIEAGISGATDTVHLAGVS